ncbi:MAG: thioredoxin family protein, partial [Planctomycetaceae bacterium]|nr:thioredoxin family protein [Planctomycetaceae bacterium]
MHTRTRVQVAAALFAMLLLTPAMAAALEPVVWQTDLPTALRIAQQSNRLVLLHFWSPQCGPCRALEANVFGQPGFAQTLSIHYVPVKVNVEEQPGLMQAYHITQYPTEVVVGHDGRELSRFRAPQNPASYLATAAQIARANPPVLKPFHSGPATAPSIAVAP